MEEIIEIAKKIIKTDKRYLTLIKSSDHRDVSEIVDLIIGAVKLVNEIKLALAEHDPECLEIDDKDIREILKKIREDKPLLTAGAYITLSEYLKPSSTDAINPDISDFAANYSDQLFELFHSKFDINSYICNKLQVGPLLTSSSLPDELNNYFYELKEAYAYGLHKSCIALCRMLLEISFADCLYKQKCYKDAVSLSRKAKDNPHFEFSLFENINIASSLNIISENLKKNAHKIRLNGNKTVHYKKEYSKNDYIHSLEIIMNTITIIESLYTQTKVF